MSKKKTVLVVVAHADDLEFTCGGTVARMTRELGFDVYEYILTDNARGSYRLDADELIAVSADEAKRAGEILGLKEVRLEGYTDGDLDQVPMHVLRGQVMAMCREVKADIVISWDPFAPDEDHPDHRAIGMATYEAASFCGNPKFHPEHPHPPYPVTEAYWIAKNPNTSSTTLLRLSKNNNVEVLRAVKSNPKTPALVRQRLSVEKLPQAVRQNPTQSLVGAQSLYAASCEPNFTDLVVDLDEDEIVGAMLRFAKHATPRQWRTGVELLDNWKGTFEELFEASGYLASSPT